MKNTLIKIVPFLVAVIFAFLFFRQCSINKSKDNSRKSVELFLNDSISYYKNKVGQEVAQKLSISGDKDALKILLSKKIDSIGQLKALVEKFKKISAAGNITTVTIIDSILVPYEVPILFEFHREWEKKDLYYTIRGTSNELGLTIDDLEIPNTLSFAIGDKKTSFFKSEYRIESVNSNPFVKTIGLDSYTLEVPKKRLGLSLYVGGGISSNFTFEPQIGLGLSYNLIMF